MRGMHTYSVSKKEMAWTAHTQEEEEAITQKRGEEEEAELSDAANKPDSFDVGGKIAAMRQDCWQVRPGKQANSPSIFRYGLEESYTSHKPCQPARLHRKICSCFHQAF